MDDKEIFGVDALIYADNGERVEAGTPEDWDQWVSATRTRNYVLGDPVLDWLHLFGVANGFSMDTELPKYDKRTDFTEFIFAQGALFEERVVSLLRDKASMIDIATSPGDARNIGKARDTVLAMEEGVPIINQGVLFNPEDMTYGIPDLLVRSDILNQIIPGSLSEEVSRIGASGIKSTGWHYRVVDIKFTTLKLQKGGELGNRDSAPAYKCQLYVYNQALGRILGYQPDSSFLLGRGWTESKDSRGDQCLERLATVTQSGAIANKVPIDGITRSAQAWIRELRASGGDWSILPQPDRAELYPNHSNTRDSPWHSAKGEILEQLEDVTLMWQVGTKGRVKAHQEGVFRWTDPRFSPGLAGMKEGKTSDTLQKILDSNKLSDGPNILPSVVQAGRSEWYPTPDIEFYVDFETVNDLADDFSKLPGRGGQSLIFMIGCGHMENGEWVFRSFTVNHLTEPEEGEIILSWLTHMQEAVSRLSPDEQSPRIYHWSHAETSTLLNAYNSAWERHGNPEWPSLNWYDFLQNVARNEPVIIKGATGFGLKQLAKSMYKMGLIETSWEDGPSDGLGAMVGAWWASRESGENGQPLQEIDLMQEIIDYNEVDCKVMMEIVAYLRKYH